MKKQPKPLDLEDDDLRLFSKGIEKSDGDDDIIDLDDVIESGDLFEDEEDIGLDSEILDVDADLDLPEFPSGAGAAPGGSGARDILADSARVGKSARANSDRSPDMNPLAGLTEEPRRERSDAGRASADDLLLSADLSDDDELDLFSSSRGPRRNEVEVEDLFKDLPPLPEPSSKAKPERTEVSRESEPALAAMIAPKAEPQSTSIVAPSAAATDAGIAPSPPPVQNDIESFVSRIEASLVEEIRRVVDARLPEIARSIIQEEIARLRREMKGGQ